MDYSLNGDVSTTKLLEQLLSVAERLEQLAAGAEMPPDSEQLELELKGLDRRLERSMRSSLSQEERASIEEAARAELERWEARLSGKALRTLRSQSEQRHLFALWGLRRLGSIVE